MSVHLVRGLAAAAALLALAAPAGAQLASPSPAALGLGENFTARARGYEAVAWNPAGLALPGGTMFSLGLMVPRGTYGIDPVSLSDLKAYENQLVPTEVKRRWLDEIRQEGSQSGSSGFDATWLALQVGRFGLQASSSGRALSDVSPGVAELILFGNADEEGRPKDVDLSGSSFEGAAYSAAGVSYAQPFTLGHGGRLSVGVTATYTIGHLVALASNPSGRASVDPLEVQLDFPVIHTGLEEDSYEVDNGSGVGIDIGVGYAWGPWVIAGVVHNLVNTFAWDESRLRYRPTSILFSEEVNEAALDTLPLTEAPAELRQALDDLAFQPRFALGASWQATSRLTLTGDVRAAAGAALGAEETLHVGAGAELRVLPILPLRVGLAAVSLGEEASGFTLAAGAGLHLGPISVELAAARRDTGLGADTILMASVLSFGL